MIAKLDECKILEKVEKTYSLFNFNKIKSFYQNYYTVHD